jgi:hypothetical protein
MKISELKERKILRRATGDFDIFGSRVYKKIEYYLPVQTDFPKSERQRQWAKIIDIIPTFMLTYLIFQHMLLAFAAGIPLMMITGAFAETQWGNSLGKKIFKIKVIDEFGDYPDFSTSLKRNMLILANFYPSFSEKTVKDIAFGTRTFYETSMSMKMNNKLCKTYTVKENMMWTLRKMLDQQKIDSRIN